MKILDTTVAAEAGAGNRGVAGLADRGAPAVVFVGHDALRTGAPNSLLKIVRWFARNTPFRIVVVLNRDGPLRPEYERVAKTYVVRAGTERWWRFPNLQRLHVRWRLGEMLRMIRKARPICIFNNTGVNGDLVRVLKAATGAAVISRIPELEAFMRRNSRNGAVQEVLRCSDHVVAVSEAVRGNLCARHGVAPERVSVVFGACDHEVVAAGKGQWRQRLGIPPGDTVVCGCGTQDWRKGFDLFLQTAHAVCTRQGRSDIRFVWIGGGLAADQRIETEYEIESLGLASSLFLVGEIDSPSQCFADANIFFLSSREDPFPLVMLEAARQGLPVVCFAGSGGATEFVDGEIGAVVPMLHVDAAAAAIIELADEPALAAAKGQAAAKRSMDYTVERMCAGIHAIVRQVISAREGVSA